jgi:hypothetical protein
MAEINREWLFRELRRSLTLLAAEGDTALTGVAAGCCKPDELALDFDNFRAAVIGNFATELPPALATALADVDAAFGLITGDGWSETAVRSAPEWATVRQRARMALRLLDRLLPGIGCDNTGCG